MAAVNKLWIDRRWYRLDPLSTTILCTQQLFTWLSGVFFIRCYWDGIITSPPLPWFALFIYRDVGWSYQVDYLLMIAALRS